jgi:hypothetical protein
MLRDRPFDRLRDRPFDRLRDRSGGPEPVEGPLEMHYNSTATSLRRAIMSHGAL